MKKDKREEELREYEYTDREREKVAQRFFIYLILIPLAIWFVYRLFFSH